MLVHIDGKLFAEADRLLSERWNGWVVPVFSDEERERIVEECDLLGWEAETDSDGDSVWRRVKAERLSDSDGWVAEGWCWSEVDIYEG